LRSSSLRCAPLRLTSIAPTHAVSAALRAIAFVFTALRSVTTHLHRPYSRRFGGPSGDCVCRRFGQMRSCRRFGQMRSVVAAGDYVRLHCAALRSDSHPSPLLAPFRRPFGRLRLSSLQVNGCRCGRLRSVVREAKY
jgi:hypothetical protein